MSLFPAYSQEGGDSNATPSEQPLGQPSIELAQDTGWLSAKSFQRESPTQRRREKSRSRERTKKAKRSRRSESRDRRSRSRSRGRSRSRSRRRSKSRRRSRSSSSGDSYRRHKKSKKDRHKKKAKKSSSQQVPSISFSQRVSAHSVHKTFVEDVGVRPEDAFAELVKGDFMLLKEKATPAHKLAKYRRKFNRVMGTNALVDDKQSVKKKPLRFFQKSYVCKFLNEEGVTKILKDATNKLNPFLGLDKILLPTGNFEVAAPGQGSSKVLPTNPLKVYDECTVAYLDGKKKRKASLDDDLDDEDTSIKLHYVQEETKKFNEKLRQDPRERRPMAGVCRLSRHQCRGF